MLLEEAYETFDAVEEARLGRPESMREELGDLLFQIVFYAQVAEERGEFDIRDVIENIHSKMVRRHPHVFGDESARDTAEVLRNWEAIKAEEKRAHKKEKDEETSLLDGVSRRAPALMEAHQLTAKAARVRFDWPTVEEVFDKLHEEIEELRAAIREEENEGASEEKQIRIREEVGDVLFAVANLARHLKVEPEAALKLTNGKFRRRFGFIEESLRARGTTPDASTLEEMDELWEKAKEKR